MHLSTGAELAERYRLTSRIATGGMGEVWEAMDTRLHRRVAVKVLKPEISADQEFLDRFRVEARTAAGLNHPGVAGVYDYGETSSLEDGAQETAYLVMELVEGEPLSAVLARGEPVALERSLDMLEQTGRALQAAHARGVVHRDVKPGNILITPAGQVKITDFGIAKAVDAAPVTRTGMVMGTAQYIAPEQALGQVAGPASDVYSLGVVGYEAVSGRRPFTSDNALTVAMMHIRDTPPPLPTDVPDPVRDLLMVTLAKDPEQRYRSGGEFADAVAAVRAGSRAPLPAGWRGAAAAGAAGAAAVAGGLAATQALDAAGAPTRAMGQQTGAATTALPPAVPVRAGQPGSGRGAAGAAPGQPARGRARGALLVLAAVLALGLIALVAYLLLNGAGGGGNAPATTPVPTSASVTSTVSTPPSTLAPTTTLLRTTAPTTTPPPTTPPPTTTPPPPTTPPSTTTRAPTTTPLPTTAPPSPPTTAGLPTATPGGATTATAGPP